jgi:hypothetical protein
MMNNSSQVLTILLTFVLCSATYPQSNAAIRKVDFANFTYPIDPGLKGRHARKQTFTLTNGNFSGANNAVGMRFSRVSYGDVTGDGNDDAIVELGVDTDGGTAIIKAVYIFTWRNNRARYLWSFVSGDRADGGLRNVYADKGQLVIELFGKGTRIGGKIFGTESGGVCCPSSVTRTRYIWDSGRFLRRGASEIFLNPAKGASRVN